MIHFIEHIIMHTLEDTVQLLPFLFLVFLLLEYLEHSFGHKTQAVIQAADKAGPLLGGLLGAIPQCGFSVMTTNLFCGRVVTLGTLIAVYLSTSDEMLPILLSHHAGWSTILKFMAIKALIGIASGFCVDMLFRSTVDPHCISAICDDDHCDCGHTSPVASALHHTINIFTVIVFVTLILNAVIELVGMDAIRNLMDGAGLFSPLLACVVGLIPNCASSVVITELYMNQAIPFGTALSGLLASSGVAWVVLFRVNKNKAENFKILGIVAAVSIVSGAVCNALGLQL